MFLDTIGTPGSNKLIAKRHTRAVIAMRKSTVQCSSHYVRRLLATWVGSIMHIETGMIIMHIEVACMGERFLSAGVTHDGNVGQAILTRRACLICDTHHAKVGPYCTRCQQEASKN